MIHVIEAYNGNTRMPNGAVVAVFSSVCGKRFSMAKPANKGAQVSLMEHPQNPAADDQPCPTCFGLAVGEGDDREITDEDGSTTLDEDILTNAEEDLERDGATLKEDDGRDISDRDGQVLSEDDGRDLEVDGQVLKEEKEDFPPVAGQGGWI